MKISLYPLHPLCGRRRKGSVRWGGKWLFMLLCGAALGLPHAAQAQQSPADLLAALEAEGFENLNVAEDAGNQGVHIAYENRRYRWEVKGLGVVLALAAAHQEGRLSVTPLHTGVPLARIEVEAADYRAFLRGEMNEEELFSRLLVTNNVEAPSEECRNSSFGKIDLTFSPGVRVNLVTPAPPGVLTGGELRLNPGVYATLWRGMTFDGTYSYPLSSSQPVLSRVAASYNARLGGRGFFQTQAGRLAEDLDGCAAQVSYPSEGGRSLLGLNAAFASYPGWKRQLSYQAFCSWKPTDLDVTATLSAGRYLQGDNGYSLSLVSSFGERSVELFVTDTSLSRTLGAGFTIPLGFQRQPYPGAVRLRFRNAFRFMYTDEKPMYSGGLSVPFADGYQVALRRLNRAYLRTYALQLREAGSSLMPEAASKPGE